MLEFATKIDQKEAFTREFAQGYGDWLKELETLKAQAEKEHTQAAEPAPKRARRGAAQSTAVPIEIDYDARPVISLIHTLCDGLLRWQVA